MKRINLNSIVTFLLLLGIVVMINLISVRYFVRADLTSGNMYSLTDASKELVGSIPDKLIVKVYFSPDLPGQYAGIERYLRDLLEDYRAYAKGHLQYEIIDPGTAEALETEAQSFGVPPMTVQAIEDDKVEVKRVYMGMVFMYGDKRETIPTIMETSNLEYEITCLIHRLSKPDQPVLGVASTGTEQQSTTTQNLYEALARVYDLRPLSLDAPIPPEFDGVFVVAPRQPFTEWQKFNLDQFIMRGGKVGMFMNSYQASLQQVQGGALPFNLNINDMLNQYGIGLGEDVLMDVDSNSISVREQQGFITTSRQVKYPYMPIIRQLNTENLITRELQQVAVFYPSSVDTTLAADMGYSIESLLWTSPQSGRKTGPYVQIAPTLTLTQEDFTESNIPVAAVVRGAFKSAFAQTGPPARPASEPGGAAMPYDGPMLTECTAENRIIVVGDGNMLLDEYIRSGAKLTFIQNAADWLLLSGELISIRSKQLPLRPLKEVPDAVRNLIKWLNRIGPVILAILLGVVLWQVRRVKNKALMAGE
jgi:gliding-associated putative ABC transporter substrate-binding component GldG